MGAPRQHIRREVNFGKTLPANHDKTSGEVAKQDRSGSVRPLRRQPRRGACSSTWKRKACSMWSKWQASRRPCHRGCFLGRDRRTFLRYFCALGPKPPQEVSRIGMKRVLLSSCLAIARNELPPFLFVCAPCIRYRKYEPVIARCRFGWS